MALDKTEIAAPQAQALISAPRQVPFGRPRIVKWATVQPVKPAGPQPQPNSPVSVPVIAVAVHPDPLGAAPVTVSDRRCSGFGTVDDGGHLNPPKPLTGMTCEYVAPDSVIGVLTGGPSSPVVSP